MKNKVFFLIINVFLCLNSFGNNDTLLFDKIINKKIFLFGERHWAFDQTALAHRALFIELLKKGHKNFYFGVEYSPSLAVKIQQFIDTKDSSYMKYFTENFFGYDSIYRDFANCSDSINVRIIPLDLESKIHFEKYLELSELVELPDKKNIPSILIEILGTSSRRKIEKLSRIIMNDSLIRREVKEILDYGYGPFYWRELQAIANKGFIKNPFLQIFLKNRDINMGRIIDELSLDTSSCIMASIGRLHLTKEKDNGNHSVFLDYIKTVDPNDIAIIPILYFPEDQITYRKETYSKSKGNISILEKTGMFDLIFFAFP